MPAAARGASIPDGTGMRCRRKKKSYPDPPRRILIDEAVREGRGECGQASNCLSAGRCRRSARRTGA